MTTSLRVCALFFPLRVEERECPHIRGTAPPSSVRTAGSTAKSEKAQTVKIYLPRYAGADVKPVEPRPATGKLSAIGAETVLVAEDDDALRACVREAAEYDLDVLFEVHDAGELRRALAIGATLIGINNRNLRTFETDLAVSEYLLPEVPPGVMVISESGMRHAGDILRLHAAGARGFLIGEALMRSEDPRALVSSLKEAVQTRAVSP